MVRNMPHRIRRPMPQPVTPGRLSVRQDRDTGRWAVRRGDRLIRACRTWGVALAVAVRVADSDRRAAAARQS